MGKFGLQIGFCVSAEVLRKFLRDCFATIITLFKLQNRDYCKTLQQAYGPGFSAMDDVYWCLRHLFTN